MRVDTLYSNTHFYNEIPSTRNSFQQSFSLSSVWKTCLCVEKGVHSEQPLRLFVNFGKHRRHSHYFKKRLYFKWEKVLISPEKDFLVVFLLKTKTINSNVLREVWEYWTGALKLPLEWPTFIPATHDENRKPTTAQNPELQWTPSRSSWDKGWFPKDEGRRFCEHMSALHVHLLVFIQRICFVLLYSKHIYGFLALSAW